MKSKKRQIQGLCVVCLPLWQLCFGVVLAAEEVIYIYDDTFANINDIQFWNGDIGFDEVLENGNTIIKNTFDNSTWRGWATFHENPRLDLRAFDTLKFKVKTPDGNRQIKCGVVDSRNKKVETWFDVTTEWQEFTLDISSGINLGQIMHAFFVVTDPNINPPNTLFVDAVRFVGPSRELHRVDITPESVKVASGEQTQFSGVGYDDTDHLIGNVTFTWSVVSGGGSIDANGVFTAGPEPGFYENTIQVEATKNNMTKVAHASVTIKDLHRIDITPESVKVALGAQTQLTAMGYDDTDDLIGNVTFKWSVVNGGGSINANGMFTAGSDTGFYENTIQVEATKSNVTKVAQASVTIVKPLDVKVTISELPAVDGYLYMCLIQNVGIESCYSFELRYNGDAPIAHTEPSTWGYTAEAGTISWLVKQNCKFGVLWCDDFAPEQSRSFSFTFPKKLSQIEWQAKNTGTGNLDSGLVKTPEFADTPLSPMDVEMRVSVEEAIDGHRYTFLIRNLGVESCYNFSVRYIGDAPVAHSEPSTWGYNAEVGTISWLVNQNCRFGVLWCDDFAPGQTRSFSFTIPQQSPQLDWKAKNTGTGNLDFGLLFSDDSIITLEVAKVSAPMGGEAEVEVRISNADGLAAFDIVMDFDPTKLEFVPPPTLDQVKDFTVETNIADGSLKVGGFAQDALQDADGTGGLLMTLTFKVIPDAQEGEVIPIQLTSETKLHDSDNKVIPLQLQSGSVKVQECLLGDVNDDGSVKSVDARMALQIAVGKLDPTPKQFCAADVSQDGSVKSIDARMILLKSIGMPAFAPAYAMGGTPSLQWHVAHHGKGALIHLVAKGLVAGDARLAGVTEGFHIQRGDGLIEYHALNGQPIFAWSDTAAGTTPRIVLSMTFPNSTSIDALRDFGKAIHLEDAVFYTPDGQAVHLQMPQLPLESLVVPKQDRLLPNYPNPFNPETWIPFELAESSAISIHIYDTLGRLVRTLDLGTQVPGAYYSRGRAAYWDGRNKTGETVASGSYYVELQTAHTRQVRRVVVLK